MLTAAYEYKLKPTKQQIEAMQHISNVCRSAWNYALSERKDWSVARQCSVNACSLPREYIMSADVPYPNYHKRAKALMQAKQNFVRSQPEP